MSGTTLSGNTASFLGGGIAFAGRNGALGLTNTTVSGNNAIEGGGIYVPQAYLPTLTVATSTFSGNSASSTSTQVLATDATTYATKVTGSGTGSVTGPANAPLYNNYDISYVPVMSAAFGSANTTVTGLTLTGAGTMTNVTVYSGTATAPSTTVLATTTTVNPATGAFTVTLPSAIPAGTTVWVQATDVLGNVSGFYPLEAGVYSVTYIGNTNTGGAVPVDSTSYSDVAGNNTVTVLGNTGSLVKTGYTFTGWNTTADGSGTAYAPGATFTISANTTLYAQWQANPTTYAVTYDGNTNTSGTAPTDSTAYGSGNTVTVLGAGSLVKAGYTFAGWNTQANGSGTSYAAGTTFAITANVTLYAQWQANATTYTVTYNGNGNTGGAAPSDTTAYTSGATVTVSGNTGALVRTGYTFAGWNTAADGSGTTYAAGATFAIGANVTLYAQWQAVPAQDATSTTPVPLDGRWMLALCALLLGLGLAARAPFRR